MSVIQMRANNIKCNALKINLDVCAHRSLAREFESDKNYGR